MVVVWSLTAKEGTYTNDPIGVLDVSILQNNILEKYLPLKIKEQIQDRFLLRGMISELVKK
jgi:uncharacterized protein (DUF1015 family)